MCIIQGDTKHVGDTQIFSFATRGGGQYQVTVYSNEIQLNKEAKKRHNAMILAVPRGNEDFGMIDLSNDKDVFKKLEKCFPVAYQGPVTLNSRSFGTSKADYLEVKSCGSYRYSLVPTLQDFERVDPSVFQIDGDVKSLLSSKYENGFAFLVCKIAESKKFHPVAYFHPIPKSGKLFVPTLHFHQGQDHPLSPDWDHEIYVIGNSMVGVGAHDLSGLYKVTTLQNFLPRIKAADLRKIEINGQFPNQDLWIPILA